VAVGIVGGIGEGVDVGVMVGEGVGASLAVGVGRGASTVGVLLAIVGVGATGVSIRSGSFIGAERFENNQTKSSNNEQQHRCRRDKQWRASGFYVGF